MLRRKEICNNTGDSKKACTLWHTGYPVCTCVLLMIYRARILSIFCYHICDHVFSDYGVVISCACSVLSVDRRQLPEQEKYLVAYIIKS